MNVRFIKPMESASVQKLPVGPHWTYEVKLDGFRMEAVRATDNVILYSRQEKALTSQFPQVARELTQIMLRQTVLDGELVALDEKGIPQFNLLQNYRSGSHLMYLVFDILVDKRRDLTKLPLSEPRSLVRSRVQRNDDVQL